MLESNYLHFPTAIRISTINIFPNQGTFIQIDNKILSSSIIQAVKLCHAAVESVTPFIKMRWIKEIEYLNQTRCDELVGGINVQPETFLAELNGSNANGMPALIMEYCDGGNLRQLFNQHRNVCGMVESDVKQILFALKNAIFHLHSHSFPIVHHNICPENVIIKLDRNNRRIYKVLFIVLEIIYTICLFNFRFYRQLCNLGKTISTDVRCAEVSGITAFDYIAPELIISENNHNIAADYWSVGVIVYEAATGYRPFAPHLPSGQWMLRVRDKKSEHITIYEKDNGEFVYSDRIMAENKMSTIFAEMLERWLRPALEWHPKQRGFVSVEREDQSTPPLQSMKFYELIHVMRKTKVLTLFVLTNQRSLSMAIDRNTTYDNLFEFIEREAQIPKSKCNLIRASDTKHDCIDTSKGKPIDLYVYDHNICDDNPMVYVNQIGGIGAASTTNLSSLNNGTDDTSIAPDIPDSVRNVLLNHEQRLKVHSLSKFATDTLYFVQSETRNYHNSLRGWHNYAQQISQAIDARRQDVKQLQSNAYGLKGALDLYAQTVDVAQTACDINDDTIGKCAEQSTKIAANIELLMEACDRIINRYESMDRRSRNACKNEVLHKYRNSNDIYDMTNVSKAYDLLRAQVDNKKFVDKPHFELFQCAYKCLKRRDALLRNKEFVEVQR